MAGLPLAFLVSFVSIDMKFMIAALELQVELPSPRSYSPEKMPKEWMRFARRNKTLHEAARVHDARMSDVGLVTAAMLGIAGGFVNILFGDVSVDYGAGDALDISQVALGLVSVVRATIISADKQLSGRPKPFYTVTARCTTPSLLA